MFDIVLHDIPRNSAHRSFSIDVNCLPISKRLMILPIHPKSAILVANAAHRPPWIQLVFELNRLVLRGGHVRGKGHEEIAGDSLLDCDSRAGVLLAAARQHRVDGQMR